MPVGPQEGTKEVESIGDMETIDPIQTAETVPSIGEVETTKPQEEKFTETV